VPSERTRGAPDEEGALLQLVYVAYVAGSIVARLLPERAVYGAAAAAGTVSAFVARRRRAQVARNLGRVTGLDPCSRELRRLVRAAFASYARYWLETFRLTRMDPEFFLERFECRHVERLDAALARGRGAVVVVGHLGNWDAAGAWAGASGRRPAAVAEVLRPRRLFEFFRRHRARLGMTIFPAVAGVTNELVAAARAGRLVALLADRDLSRRGVLVDFFGAPTTLPVGPASIAFRAGAPLLVVGVYGVRRPDGTRGWQAEVSEPIALPPTSTPEALAEVTRAVARELEAFIARRPEEWHMFQPFWIEDRSTA
jgi:lauroyl/myristoyl acyltransferase